jgi:hypothetical protein
MGTGGSAMAGVADPKARRGMSLFPPDAGTDVRLRLSLTVVDRDTVDELTAYADPEEREAFALNALRIGVLALRQARGRVDADLIQRETQRLLAGMESQLTAHATAVQDKLAGSLKEYFDPESGRFHERVQQLVREDGELEQVLRRQIGGDDSQLCKTLVAHFGQQSPLMKILNPRESEGLLAALAATLEERLDAQRNHVLREFSLDNKEGALARMIAELSGTHGQLTEALSKKIDTVVSEFSLDKEGSALSRLVRNVERAQTTITREFSLDDEASALARMKRELVAILHTNNETNTAFQEEVKVALGKMAARREEADRSTRHGIAFEDAVCEFLEQRARQCGDIAHRTGFSTGLIKNNKKGDCVVELSPDSAAPSARVVVEAKEEAGYTMAKARAEIESARENRAAQVGLFVFSKRTAPGGVDDGVFHFGNDVFVVWDAEDATTDLQLKIALTLARALCVRVEQTNQAHDEDFQEITKAILEIEKQSEHLSEVTRSAETIQSGSEKILERVRKTRNSLERQVEILQTRIGQFKPDGGT